MLVAALSPTAGGTAAHATAAAAGSGHLTSIANANAKDRAGGGQFDAAQLTAPTPCDPAATRHVTRIIAVHGTSTADKVEGQKWVGQPLYATASAGLPGPLTVRSNGSWQQLADAYHLRLVPGTYELELRCQDNLGQKIFQTWTGDVTFSSPTRWTGFLAKGGGSASPTASSSGKVSPTVSSPASPPASASGAAGSTAISSPDGSGSPGGASSSTGPSVAGATPTPSATTVVADQKERSSDPALRKYLILGGLALVVAAVLLLSAWRRTRTDPALEEHR